MTTLQEALDRIAQLEAENLALQNELEASSYYLRDVQEDYRDQIYRMEQEIRTLEADLDEARYRERMEG